MTYIDRCISEIKKHSAFGYHEILGKVARNRLLTIDFPIPEEYSNFVGELGYGNFFGARLRLFGFLEDVEGNESRVQTVLSNKGQKLLIIGSDGTTEGVYCIDENGNVGWLFLHDLEYRSENGLFKVWIETKFKDLFDATSYSHYAKIKDILGAKKIIEARKMYSVRLLSYDKELVKKPEDGSKGLSRYNKLVFSISEPTSPILKFYTVKCSRVGSIYGEANIDFVSIPLESKESTIEVLLFDSFNVQFGDIIVDTSPEIDLFSSDRGAYKELSSYL